MAFLIHSTDGGIVPPWEQLPADDLTYNVGDLLYMTGGHLVKCASGAGDTGNIIRYVCMQDKTISTDGDKLDVIRASHDIVFEAPLTAANSSIATGAVYTVVEDGVTATATSGVFAILSYDGTAIGSLVRGRFN